MASICEEVKDIMGIILAMIGKMQSYEGRVDQADVLWLRLRFAAVVGWAL